jgi:hypothetical protein
MAAILGILQSFFGMCCYDAPAHMTEGESQIFHMRGYTDIFRNDQRLQ